MCLCGHDESCSDCSPSSVQLARTNRVRQAALPILHYLAMREACPMRQMDDVIHSIHTGTEFEADLKLSDIKALRDALEDL